MSAMIFTWMPGERAVGLGAHLHVGDLVAALMGDHHVLRPRLDPLHRLAELAGDRGEEDLLAVDLQLRAEPAADLRGDDADLLLVLAEQQRQEEPHEVGDLGRGGEREARAARLGEDAARLDRRAGDAVVDDAPLADDVGLGHHGVHVAAAQRPLVGLVGPEVLVDERRAVLERRLEVGDRGQRLVVDEDVLGRVLHLVAAVADDDGDRVADVVDLADRERPVVEVADLDARRHPGHRQRAADAERGHVLAREDGDDAAGCSASDLSIEAILACASVERTNAHQRVPAG